MSASSTRLPDQSYRSTKGRAGGIQTVASGEGRALGARYGWIDRGFAAIAATRADHWLAPFARGLGVILTLHHVRPWRERGFAPNRLLEITPDFLDRTIVMLRDTGFDIVSLDDAMDHLDRHARTGERPARPFAVLTFDDGYRDNVAHAKPVLDRHDVPWTLFACVACAEGRARLWWLDLEEAICRLDLVSARVAGETLSLPARTDAEKQTAWDRIYWRLRGLPEPDLLAEVATLAGRAGIDGSGLSRDLCLTFDELRTLAADARVTIGAHSLTHPRLAFLPEAEARSEIEGSKTRLETELGRPVRHFAYPVGDRTSAGPREFRLAEEAGFVSAVTTRPGHLFRAHAGHRHALPRVSLNGHFQTSTALRALLSGVPFLLWNRGRRINVG